MERHLEEEMIYCCQRNDVEGLDAIFSCGKPLNLHYRDASGKRAIHFAASSGSVELLGLLISNGTPVNCADDNGYYPIHYAVSNGRCDLLQFLISKGASLHRSRTREGYTVLHLAVVLGQHGVLETLVKSAINVNVKSVKDRLIEDETALSLAVSLGDMTSAKILLEAGASCNIPNGNYSYPLHIALERSEGHIQFDVVKLLISYGADVDGTDGNGRRPLHIAVNVASVEVARVLLEAGANVNFLLQDMLAPIHIAALGRNLEMTELLLEFGADVTVETLGNSNTALLLAAAVGSAPVARRLIQAGSDVGARSKRGFTALHNAIISIRDALEESTCREELVDVLIGAGAEINATCPEWFTPLHTCCFTLADKDVGFGCMRRLVEAGAVLGQMHDLYSAEPKRNSPFCCLALTGHWEAADYLVKAGWDLTTEPWIELHGGSNQIESYIETLRTCARTVKPLTLLCRDFIRNLLISKADGCEILSKIDCLPLPTRLKEHLKLRDIV